jgi:hypothetical protein
MWICYVLNWEQLHLIMYRNEKRSFNCNTLGLPLSAHSTPIPAYSDRHRKCKMRASKAEAAEFHALEHADWNSNDHIYVFWVVKCMGCIGNLQNDRCLIGLLRYGVDAEIIEELNLEKRGGRESLVVCCKNDPSIARSDCWYSVKQTQSRKR